MENANARLLMGIALGLVLGLGIGWLLVAVEESERPAASMLIGSATPAPAAGSHVFELEPERAERRAARADSGPVARDVTDAELDALAAEVAAPSVEHATGAGVIAGRVTDPDGLGLPAVLLRAVRDDETQRSISSSTFGAGPPPLDALRAAVLQAAREHAELLARTYETRSDATGSYRFDRLPEGRYRIDAYAEGYVVDVVDGGGSYAEPDAALDFLARPVVRLPLRVTLPEGGPPAKAVVLAMPLDERDPSATSYTWSPQDSELRLTPGRYEINALGERVALSAGEPPSSLRSETKTVELAAEELRLVAGENRASVAVPTLYPVSVKSLAEHACANAFIAPVEGARGLRLWIGADNHELDADGRARFEYVPAGRYTVRILVGSEEHARRDIVVPCGELQLGG